MGLSKHIYTEKEDSKPMMETTRVRRMSTGKAEAL
jgi:hypothetical protein